MVTERDEKWKEMIRGHGVSGMEAEDFKV